MRNGPIKSLKTPLRYVGGNVGWIINLPVITENFQAALSLYTIHARCEINFKLNKLNPSFVLIQTIV